MIEALSEDLLRTWRAVSKALGDPVRLRNGVMAAAGQPDENCR
jgi:hypothetical protein